MPRLFARTALAQSFILLVSTGLATTHCSPSDSTSGSEVACGNVGGVQFASVRAGHTTLRRTASAQDGRVASQLRVERDGQLVYEVSSSLDVAVDRAPRAHIEVHFGEVFRGLHELVLEGDPRDSLRGTADGKAVQPIDSKSTAIVFAAGGEATTPTLDDADVRAELDAVFAKARGEGAGGRCGLGASAQAVKSPVHDDPPALKCATCWAGCVGVMGLTVAGGAPVCQALGAFCLVCGVVCMAGVLAAALGELYLCQNACQKSFFCTNNGTRCDSDKTKSDADAYRCAGGQTCIDAKKQLCCPQDTTPCNGNTCCEKGETCGATGCCVPPSKAIGSECCPRDRQRKSPTGADVCCGAGTAVCADGTCCTLGACVGGGCCANPCGSECCGGGDACITGTCCPSERACGAICCFEGQVCQADGTCGPAASVTCPPGTVPKTDQADASKFVCCAPGAAGCAGECCSTLGQQCCLKGGAYSCRTDCIK